MTFKDLKKFVDSQRQPHEHNQLQKLKGKPFWEWDSYKHKQSEIKGKGACCMQHIIGLPKKGGKGPTMFDYEKMLLDALLDPGYLNSDLKLPSKDPKNVLYPFKVKHLFVKSQRAWAATSSFLDSWQGYVCAMMDQRPGTIAY
jgi:hypothetical protein